MESGEGTSTDSINYYTSRSSQCIRYTIRVRERVRIIYTDTHSSSSSSIYEYEYNVCHRGAVATYEMPDISSPCLACLRPTYAQIIRILVVSYELSVLRTRKYYVRHLRFAAITAIAYDRRKAMVYITDQ